MYYHSPRKTKYGETRASFDGKVYHSKLERDDAMWLHALEKDGEISELKEQVRYRIFHNDVHICDSIVDFQFKTKEKTVWYESKGFVTDKYRVVRKLIEAEMRNKTDEVYIVNSIDLQKFLRGRLSPTES